MRVFAEPCLAHLTDKVPSMLLVRTGAELALRPTAEKIDGVLTTVPNCARICLDLERVAPKNDDGHGVFPGGVWNPTNAKSLNAGQLGVCARWYREILTRAAARFPRSRIYTYGGPNAIPENPSWMAALGDAVKLFGGAYHTLSRWNATDSIVGLRSYVSGILKWYENLFDPADVIFGMFPVDPVPACWWEAANEAVVRARCGRHFIVNPTKDDPDGVKAAMSIVDKVETVL